MYQKTVLLVEDEAIISMAETDMLRNAGYIVKPAFSGEEACKILEQDCNIDLVLMDIDLGPGIDGINAALSIQKQRNIPIIFLSSHCEKAIVEKVKNVSRYGYVYKGGGDFVLLSSIEMAFQLHGALIELEKQNQRLEEAMDLARIAWWDMELPEGRVEFDKRRAAFLGFDPRDFKSSADFVRLVHPEDQVKIKQMADDLLKNKLNQVSIDYRIKNSEGKYIWNRDSGQVVFRDKINGRIRLRGFVQEISDINIMPEKTRAR